VTLRAVGWDDDAVTAGGEHGRIREMLTASVRYVPRPVVKAGAGALFLITWHAPRRLPDLVRFTASAGLASLHDPAAAWTGAQFGLIESGAPWLDLAGRRLDDYCRVSGDKSMDLRLAPVGAECRRSVTAIYGADGPLAARLADLGAVLGHAGWAEFFSYGAPSIPAGSLQTQRPPVTGQWQPAVVPGGPEAVPPAGVRQSRQLTVGWASRGQPPDAKWTLDGRWHQGQPASPEPPRTASRYCRPVDCRYADTEALAADALSRHNHAIALRIGLCYDLNPDVRHFPMRKRILPTPG
jgi:hypothetical protein